jgi:hypothetical protein
MKKLTSVCLTMAAALTIATPTLPQAAREVTIEPETKARLVLQSRLSSKLNEVGDTITAVLYEPIYVNGLLAMPRGTEFHGRVTAVKPARRTRKQGEIAIIFDRVVMPWGEEPVSVLITAIEDWDKNEKLKADQEGKVKGGGRDKETVENVVRGGQIGGLGASTVILAGRSAGAATAGAAMIGGGLLAGLLLTKGGDVRLEPGAVFRIKFTKPLTLPTSPQPPGNQQKEQD